MVLESAGVYRAPCGQQVCMSCGVRRRRWQLAAGIHMVLNTCWATRSVPFTEAQISCGWTKRLAGVSHVRVSIEPASLEVENYLTPWDHPCILKSCTGTELSVSWAGGS